MNISTEHISQCNQSEPLTDASGKMVDLMNENGINEALGHLRTYIRAEAREEPPEDGEMNQRFQNSSHDGLRPSTLPLGHGGAPQYGIW